MERERLIELIDNAMEGVLSEYYSELEKTNNCEYVGDISPLELLTWNELTEKFADLFEQLAKHNGTEE